MDKIQGYDFALGFRAWATLEGYLLALHRGDIWMPGEIEARCNQPHIYGYQRHQPAGKDCSCGWHCFNYLKDACSYANPSTYNAHVVGAILGWGKIQFHANGFRSQFAVPLALIDKRFLRTDALKFNRSGAAKIIPRITKKYVNNIYANVADKYGIPRLDGEDFNLYLQKLMAQNRIFTPTIDGVLQAPSLPYEDIHLQVPTVVERTGLFEILEAQKIIGFRNS